jgi:hypothetical protein
MTNDDARTPGTESGGSADYNQPATQTERLAEVLRDRRLSVPTPAPDRKGPPTPRADRGWIDGRPETSTYFAEAGLADDEIAGGRFAPKRGPDPWPRLPPDSPWAGDPVPIEPPYGDRVDWLPDQITRDGDDQRGLTPWTYGTPPTEQHSSYDLDPNTNTEGILASVSTAQTPEQFSAASVEACAVVPSSETPQPQPQLEPMNEEPTKTET